MQTQQTTNKNNHTERRTRSPSKHKLRHSIPQETKDEIVAMFLSGEPAEEVAKAYKVGVSSVYSFARAKNVAEQRKAAIFARRAASKDTTNKESEANNQKADEKLNGRNQELIEQIKRKDEEIEHLKDLLIDALLKSRQ